MDPFVHIPHSKIYFQAIRQSHNKGLKREISAGYKELTDEVRGAEGKDDDPLLC